MTGSLPPPGWYPDPSDDQQLRWWTGERWTGAARPIEPSAPAAPIVDADPTAAAPRGHVDATVGAPLAASHAEPAAGQEDDHLWASAAATMTWADDEAVEEDARGGVAGWPRERLIAAAVIGALLATPLLIWLVAVVVQGGNDGADPGIAIGDTPDGTDGTDGTEDTEGTNAADDTDGADEADPDGTVETEGSGDEEGEQDTSDEQELETIDFDGVCTVEVAADAGDGDTPLRPWQFDECPRAPVDLDAGDDRWIVVIASIDGDTSEEDALDRAEGHGAGYGLLWSSHYPSLNPGWWVVFDGPFSSEDDATEAADDAGGGSYPRQLTDDEGDRYCIAEDGC